MSYRRVAHEIKVATRVALEGRGCEDDDGLADVLRPMGQPDDVHEHKPTRKTRDTTSLNAG
jgi:hypothetical protein